tara:strand:- start:98 stop:385 length:288 start_codon:yes stop_codon:yes gene_type:complete
MLEEKLLKILIREILKEQNVKLRTSKGYGASHPVISHKPFMKGLGKSEYYEEPKKKKKQNKEPVDVSKAFEEDPFEDIDEYSNIIREILNARNIR